MHRWGGYLAIPHDWGCSVVAIGVFDGVHRGHQHTMSHMVKRAVDLGTRSVVVTFDPHPATVIRPDLIPSVLTPPHLKADVIESIGVDALCVIPFTFEFSRLSASDFVSDILVKRLKSVLVVVGENFRFGQRASGDVTLLRELGRVYGFAVEEIPLMGSATVRFSSTYIRARISAGEVDEAERVLGRPYRLEGVVVPGDQRGRTLGFPTANIAVDEAAAVPADGVYATWAWHGASRHPAVVSIGMNPTFAGRQRRIEAHILDFHGDLYGQSISLDFVARLRGICAYQDAETLIGRIHQDVDDTRRTLEGDL